jgi:hypothetical protein
MKHQDLSGIWAVNIQGLGPATATLPGTLDGNGIGFPDTGGKQWHPDVSIGNNAELSGKPCILTRLTRNHTYEGPAVFTKSVTVEKAAGKRIFLEAERSRELSLSVNGRVVPVYTQGTVSTPYVFEVTDFIRAHANDFTLCCDNSYPSWNRDAIVYSSAASDETQTNWNGIIGYLRLRYEDKNFISGVRCYPRANQLDAAIEIDCDNASCGGGAYSGTLTLSGTALTKPINAEVSLSAGRHTFEIKGIPLDPGAARWDEYSGALHELTAAGGGLEPRTVSFGIRGFGVKDGKLALNGRHIFLRGETNCCVFPKTGHMPTSVGEWERVLAVYKSYGVNCMRFHSHCPPKAAFDAADKMGMLMQPELSHWNTQTAFEDDKSWNYYRLELRQILHHYANHPSFVMFALGNELTSGVLGFKRMGLLTALAKRLDATRLFAIGSNNYCGDSIGTDAASDFFTAANFYKTHMRGTYSLMEGHINQQEPGTKTNFDAAVAQIREEFAGPVFGFEVGQYEILPDFDEWDSHSGVTRPDNYMYIRDKVQELGLMPDWKKRVEATGELALLAYREEIEAVLRTDEYSGLSLLGLQDFPGQGTALVGMLNAHLEPKPYNFAKPERFRRFFSDLVPLLLMEKYTYLNTETLTAEVKIANYSKDNITGPCVVRLMDGGNVLHEQTLPNAGTVTFPLNMFTTPKRLDITVAIAVGRDAPGTPGDITNDYPIWVYPAQSLSVPETVVLTASKAEALNALAEGKNVFYTPEATEENFPGSIKTQFTTDFWSVGTFAAQSGFMGCMMDPGHPVFAGFPTEFHSNWQWWAMCKDGRAMVLPPGVTSLVTALDCYARMRNMGMLVEARVGGGKLIVSSMGLMEQLHRPEVNALTQSVLNYMASGLFSPPQELPPQVLID